MDFMEGPNNMEPKVNSRRSKTIMSCSIWFCTFSFGLAYNFLSPALVELKNKYDTDIAEISKVFTIVLLCYLVGALTCGALFDYLNRQLMVVGLLSVMAVGVVVIPHCPTITIFYVVGGFIGFACGGYDTAQVVWILEMWQGEAGRYVQSQYFFFALGNLVAPLMLRPFLLEEDTSEDSEKTTTTTTTLSPLNVTSEESQLHIPLTIGGSVIVLAASTVLFLYFYDKYEQPFKKNVKATTTTVQVQSERINDNGQLEEGGHSNGGKLKKWDWGKIILIALSAIVLGCYQGMEVCTFQFMPTYAHYVDLKIPEPEGALVLSALTGAFTAGRLFGIFIVMLKVPPPLILIGNLAITLAGNIVLLIFSNTNEALLWVGASLLGLGYSTVFACIYDHIEKYLKITNKIAATMVVAGGLVSALYPLIVGDSVEYHPFILNYVIFFSIVMCTISFSSIYWITVIKKKPQITGGQQLHIPVMTHFSR